MEAPYALDVADGFAEVDRIRAEPSRRDALIALLAEQAPAYRGLSSNQSARLRGYVLASFETVGLPAPAMAFVIEELESGIDPYLAAAAAKAIRGAEHVPEHVVSLLPVAIERIRHADDVVRFQSGDDSAEPVTALTELFRTLTWLGPRAASAAPAVEAMLELTPSSFSDRVTREALRSLAAIRSDAAPAPSCCGTPPPLQLPPRPAAVPAVDVTALELEDQDGAVASFGALFGGRPSVLTFFYTRCMNPNKCSLSITKLATLQRLIAAEGLHDAFNVAAISYDPEFDLATRLKTYGAARGFAFDARNRILRTTGSFAPLQQWLDLGVGYGASTVNQHRLDLVVLDSATKPCTQISRVQWQEAEVLDTLKRALRGA